MLLQNPQYLTILEDLHSPQDLTSELIAKKAVDAFAIVLEESFERYSHMSDFVLALKTAKDELIAACPNQPCKTNALTIVFNEKEMLNFTEMKKIYAHIAGKISYVKRHFEKVYTDLSRLGSRKIHDDMIIFTHSASSTVLNIILDAHTIGTDFEVATVENRPYLYGRKMAKMVSKHNIPVSHYVDSAMRLAVKNVDVVLLGCDVIDHAGKFYSKIGSELVCEVAKRYKIPVYICTDSWKFDPNAQHIWADVHKNMNGKEVWDEAPKGVAVKNFAFEKIDPKLIDGIICEFGILTPEQFFDKMHDEYPSLFF
ncbi:MAG: translation initiation factor 2B subunit (eIF-2B alpha/beta/delta family) [Candidatus Woesearchaeota archaeon]|jgi:translation initiation factor 2B subunit (eIF-2B alpha/beta/delta family)